MSDAIQQADELRSRAIGLLLTERTAIDESLKRLGYDGTATTQPRQKVCSGCGGSDHNARTCPQKKTDAVAPVTQSV